MMDMSIQAGQLAESLATKYAKKETYEAVTQFNPTLGS